MTSAWSWITDDVLPFVAMLTMTCFCMGVLTALKAAMNDGMSSIVYVVYQNAFGILFLLPFYIHHILRKVDRPRLTFRILFTFFILGLFGICLSEILVYLGVSYSSPTLVSTIGNLGPGITFLIAVLFRMEKLDIRSSSSLAKLLGTMMAISGVMVLTFYQGPYIFHTYSTNSPNRLSSSQPSNWVLGALLVTTGGSLGCLWNVLQTVTARDFPDHQTLVFFYCLFGTIQCILLSPFIERNRSAWVLQPGIGMNAILLGAVYTSVYQHIVTWCLRKKGPVFVAMFSPLSIVIAVIMGVTFLGDSLYLGSVIGATIVVLGFYLVIWGQTKEKNKILVVVGDDTVILDKSESSHLTTSLL